GFPCADPGNSPCVSPGSSLQMPGESNAPPGSIKYSPGNWGGLAYNDGQTYTGTQFKDAIVNGYQGSSPIELGTTSGVIPTTGNDVSTRTQAALASRYNAGSQGTSAPYDPNDSRIIMIPMVESFPTGKSSVVNITGFITALITPDGHGDYYGLVL